MLDDTTDRCRTTPRLPENCQQLVKHFALQERAKGTGVGPHRQPQLSPIGAAAPNRGRDRMPLTGTQAAPGAAFGSFPRVSRSPSQQRVSLSKGNSSDRQTQPASFPRGGALGPSTLSWPAGVQDQVTSTSPHLLRSCDLPEPPEKPDISIRLSID